MAFTYFFRDLHTLNLIEKHVVPKLKTLQYLDIWDAGCAHGPEPYSLAIILRENMGHFLFRNVRIHATDLNGKFSAIIEKGVYPDEEVKRIPQDILHRYFSPMDDSANMEISEQIRKAVRFQQHDLASLEPIRDGLSLIICKNVLLHLSYEKRVQVINMFRNSLSSGGFLVMEQTQKLPEEVADGFTQVVADAQIFQKV